MRERNNNQTEGREFISGKYMTPTERDKHLEEMGQEVSRVWQNWTEAARYNTRITQQ